MLSLLRHNNAQSSILLTIKLDVAIIITAKDVRRTRIVQIVAKVPAEVSVQRLRDERAAVCRQLAADQVVLRALRSNRVVELVRDLTVAVVEQQPIVRTETLLILAGIAAAQNFCACASISDADADDVEFVRFVVLQFAGEHRRVNSGIRLADDEEFTVAAEELRQVLLQTDHESMARRRSRLVVPRAARVAVAADVVIAVREADRRWKVEHQNIRKLCPTELVVNELRDSGLCVLAEV